ncbi:hypothetical protein SAMN02746065_12358 [Desulfocicer vacuolatum DSM 3385]|uniref:Uncharacterized protein n=1 Tax=Desulfocicer vacuolatum DSM 3385 TaxID=1121400 RepID=A0A1W2E3X7_9BACT|nr:hypothetical protein SAMN02746065_12358 [Desulfocicer vacuolatum DSM 3385]
MTVNGKQKNITVDDLLTVAKNMDIPQMGDVYCP